MFKEKRHVRVMRELNEKLAAMTAAYDAEAAVVQALVAENEILKCEWAAPRPVDPPQWAAETIAERWPSNPKGAFYMLGYGASPAMVDEVVNGRFTQAQREAPVTAKHLTEERAKNKRQRRIIDELEQKIVDINEANRYKEKRERREARLRHDGIKSKNREEAQRFKRMASRERQQLMSKVKSLEERLASQARHPGVNTFMGMEIDQACEAMFTAEALARSVNRYGKWSTSHEIALRFLKLRAPRPVERKSAKVCYRCPECGEVANKRRDNPIKAPLFCASSLCGWEGDAS